LTARTLRIAAAIAAIFALASAVSVAGARDAARTKVTIHYNGDGFQGKLKSSKGKCIRNRKVKVFKKSNGHKLYSDITDHDGHWDTGNSGQVHGTFYAHTGRIPGCKGGTSKSIHT
jgi:hypothetical protein